MFNKKFILLCVGVVLIGALSMFLYRNRVPHYTFTWDFTVSSVNQDSGAPLSDVTLNANRKKYELGQYEGNCVDITTTGWKLVANEIGGAICWFAGGGTELGIFSEGKKVVIKKGVLDEGSAEESGSRGNYETVVVLDK
jgi:hypothetical protein